MGGAVNGGKADNLARLVGFGFAVPRWIALGPDDSADDLGARLASSGLGSAERFAVRSSASAEDGGELSFAGQFATCLAVPRGRLAQAVAEVRASCASEAVRAYCRARGTDSSGIRMNVIIQEMVDAESAGVAFAVDFKTGSRRAVTVSAVRGLGEGLVSESAEADTYVVRGGEIEATVAEKEHAVRFAADGGTERVALAGAARTERVLSVRSPRSARSPIRTRRRSCGTTRTSSRAIPA